MEDLREKDGGIGPDVRGVAWWRGVIIAVEAGPGGDREKQVNW
jgi:hypothetical protein